MNFARLIYRVLRISNLHLFFRFFLQRNNVSILFFHKPTTKSFKMCIDYLKKYYNIISLHDYLDYRFGKIKDLPLYSVVLTFDDGHKSNSDLLPLIKENGLKLTIFLTSGTLNTNRQYWTKHLNNRISILEAIKSDYRILQKILAQNNFQYDKEFEKRDSLNFKELDEMKEYIDFQAHSVFHLSLPYCPDDVSNAEISNSKKDLEKMINKEIKAFAFPFGLYSDREIEYIKKAGYECALTVDFGCNNKKTDLFKLKRLSVNDTEDINELIIKSSGLWAAIKTFFHI